MSLWGKNDQADNKPKFLNADEKAVTVGVSLAEAQLANNRVAGMKTPGWTKSFTYTDAQGTTRVKSEILVTLNDVTGDAADDAVVGDRTITISAHPTSRSVVAGLTTTFNVTASVLPVTALSYQWQKQEAGTKVWSNIVDATGASYTTAALAVADDNGDKFRVVVGAADTRNVTSNAATLTVTA